MLLRSLQPLDYMSFHWSYLKTRISHRASGFSGETKCYNPRVKPIVSLICMLERDDDFFFVSL